MSCRLRTFGDPACGGEGLIHFEDLSPWKGLGSPRLRLSVAQGPLLVWCEGQESF